MRSRDRSRSKNRLVVHTKGTVAALFGAAVLEGTAKITQK
jgi:hypothetical protein